LSKFNIVEISECFRINKSGWNNYQIPITPPIFKSLSDFNSNGLSIATRTFPLFATSGYKGGDTILYSKYFPDKFLSGYKIFNPDTNNYSGFISLTNGIDAQQFESYAITPEQVWFPTTNDYMDRYGNYYLNVFSGLDTINWYQSIIAIYVHGIIDTNGRMMLPLSCNKISLDVG
jgi:hypothetical protein